MAEKIKILMVDDHSLILEGYKRTLLDENEDSKLDIQIELALNCDEAYTKIKQSIYFGPYDIIFLDINLPPSSDQKFLSGEDLGLEVKKTSPTTSLIVLTMFSESLRLISILKNLDPDAFLIKSDIDPQEFLKAFHKVRNGKVHYSQSITEMMRKQVTSDIILNEHDRSILYHLSEGIRTKDLVNKVPLSLASIEKRKRMMREMFEVEREGDLALINKARKMGFL